MPIWSIPVFDSNLQSDESCYEEVLPDGTIVRHRKIRTPSSTDKAHGHSLELVEIEGPPVMEIKEETHQEILPDGTVHMTHVVRRHSVKHIRKSLRSDTGEEEVEEEDQITEPISEEIIETFDEPPRCIQQEDDVVQVMDDGRVVTKHVIMNRMVHHIKTKHKSFDESGVSEEEEYEIEEAIPGTESAFVAGMDTPSEVSESDEDEDELEGKLQADIGEVEEVLDDGTIVTRRLIASEEVRKVRSRSGSIDETCEQRFVTEEEVAPSPRSRSPVLDMARNNASQAISLMESQHDAVQTKFTTAHLEEKRSKDTIEKSIHVVEDLIRMGSMEVESSVDREEEFMHKSIPQITTTGSSGHTVVESSVDPAAGNTLPLVIRE